MAQMLQGISPIDGSVFAERTVLSRGAAYLTSQIQTDVTHDMRVMRDESFDPVVGTMNLSSDEEAIALRNDSEFGLTASLWARDVVLAARVGARLKPGRSS